MDILDIQGLSGNKVPNRLVLTVAKEILNQTPAGILGVQFVINFCMNVFLVCLCCS
jgi:hypothetical protein